MDMLANIKADKVRTNRIKNHPFFNYFLTLSIILCK